MATSHGGDFVPTGPTHDLAYEPDKFAVKTILAVPVAVIVTGVVSFIVTDLIFGTFFAPKSTVITPEIPAAAARNAAPMNDRYERISSSDRKAEVPQPRLEGIQKPQVYYKAGRDGKDGTPPNNDPSNVITAELLPTRPLPAE